MNIQNTSIEHFSFVSRNGLVAEARLGVSVDPYARVENGLSAKVWYEGVVGATWKMGDKEYVKRFNSTVSAYPSPDMRFVVVVVSAEGADYARPHNALVLNADGTLRHHVRQPDRYLGQQTEFLDAWWYEEELPSPKSPWWFFWQRPMPPKKRIGMKMLIGWAGDPSCAFEALDFDPESGEFGSLVDSGRL